MKVSGRVMAETDCCGNVYATLGAEAGPGAAGANAPTATTHAAAALVALAARLVSAAVLMVSSSRQS
jgi:hypothetical protein